MLANYSPEKENRSPSPKKHQGITNTSKSNFLVSELMKILKSNNITLPQHLSHQQN